MDQLAAYDTPPRWSRARSSGSPCVSGCGGCRSWSVRRRTRSAPGSARQGLLDRPEHVRHLRFDTLATVVSRRARPDRAALAAADLDPPGGTGLPARFQLGDRGLPIAVPERGGAAGGTGAGGGVGRGTVTHDAADPPSGSVLVVRTLSPQLGPHLDRLVAIVSETGSVLSHLAILAHEHGVATVVSYPRWTSWSTAWS